MDEVVNRHVTCPNCGYDLMGLLHTDGKARCPECGELADIWAPDHSLWSREVKQTRLLIVLCLVPFLAAAILALLTFLTTSPLMMMAAAAAAAFWIATLVFYFLRRGRYPYAGRVLVMFHLSVLSALGVVACLVLGIPYYTPWRFPLAVAVLLCIAAYQLYVTACNYTDYGHDEAIRKRDR